MNTVKRRLLRYLLFPFAKRIRYQNHVPGYAGWMEVLGVLVAFERDDGTLQYNW